MQNYYRWIGHYKNIVSDSLCDNIVNTDFNYTESTYSTHQGLSPDKKRVEMDEIWIRNKQPFYNELKEFGLEVDAYDYEANTVEVKKEYGIDLIKVIKAK